MNKIFKVIWNYATQSWVAVSELQKAKGKTKSLALGSNVVRQSFPMLKFSLITSGLLLASGQVIAATGTDNTAAGQCYYDTATNSVVCGDSTTTTNGNGSNKVAIGTGAQANNNNDISIGNKAGFGFNDKGSNFNGSGKHSFVGQGTFTTNTAETIATHSNLAIGINAGTNATGIRNIAIGENAATQHFGEESITIGYGANNFSGARKNTDGSALAAGDTYRARRTIAIGKEAMTYGEESIAIGYGANTKQASFNGSANYTSASGAVALGRNATASGDSSFAQGLSANAQGQGDIAIGLAARTLLDPSLPNIARNFRIAIGREAKVGEAALNNALAIGSSAKVLAGNNGVALGSFTQTIGNNLNVALGSSSRTWGDRPNAIGNSNTAGGFDSSAIGAQSHVLMRYGTNGDISSHGVAVGAGTVSGNSNAVALGNAVAVFGLNSGALSASSKNLIAENSLNFGDTTKLGAPNNTDPSSPITIIGGDENFAIGNNNVIGSSSNNNMVMGNRIAVGATSATTNGLINIYRLAIKDSATGQVTAQATAYIKEGSGNSAKYYAFDRNAADYKGAELDLSGKTVADEVQFVHIVPTFNNTKSINRAVAIGQSASVNDNDTIAIGTNSKAGDSSKAADATAKAIAIGTNSTANASQAISIGDTSKASGNASVALGPSTNSTGVSSTALGDGSQSTNNYATAVGAYAKARGISSVALGQDANATALYAIALGFESNASAVNSLALGKMSKALHINSVALGTNSVTADAVGTNNATVRGISYSGFAGTSPSSTVSIGHAFGERTITNVAAGRISATSTDAINGSQLYAVANNISWNITASASDGEVDGVSEERVYAGEQVKLDAGKNIKITQNGKNFTFATLENVSFTNVTTGETSMDNDGLKVGDITVTNAPITVNGTTVNNINEAINQTAAKAFSPLTFVGDEGNTPRKLGETLNIVAGNATDTSTKNLKTTVTEGKVEISMAENPVFETVQVGGDNGPKISADGDNIKIGDKDGNPTKITNVAPAELSENSKDAVNGSQLYQTNQNVTNLANNVTTLANNTIKLGDDNGTTTDAQELSKDGGLQFNVKGENGLSTKAEGSDITVTIAQSDIDVKDDGTVSAKNSGNTYATAEQVANAINKAGWFTNVSKAEGDNAKFFTTEAGKQRKVSASDKVIFQAGKNMEVKQDGDNIIYATSENVTFNTVQVGGDNGPKISADGDNIKIGDKDGNPTKITNVAAGTNATDAVNVSQLNNAAAGAKTEVEAGDHISVNQRTGVNGQTIYNVSVTTGNITKAESTGANAGKVTVADTDKGKVATVDNVAEAINSAGWLTNVGKAEGENANFFTTKAGEERKVSAGDKVIFQAGKNMEVKQDGDNVIYATSENVTFNTVQVGGDNGPKITGEGNNIKIGDKDGNPTKITNVAAGEDDNDAVNVSQLKKATAAAKTVVEGDQGVSVTPTPKADGSMTYTVAAKTDGTTIKIDASGNIAANTGTITPAPANPTDAAGNLLPNAGKVTVTGTPVGNETQEQANAREGNKLATVGDVTNAINSAGWVVNTGKAADQNSFNTAAVNHQPTKVSAGSKVNFQAGKNMEVKRDGENIIYATSDNVSFNTVTVGNTKITNDGVSIVNGPSMTKDGINAGNKVISNVAPGVKDNDAVNVSQLKGAVNNINSQLNKMDKRRKAGHASGLAVAGLMQAYREGQSAVTAGVGQYQNQSAVAVGYSRIADSGKYGVKAAFTANTQGEVGGTLSAGYFW